MQFHVTNMTKSERIAEFLFSTTNWWKGSWINHICSFILYHNALSTLTLTVVRERWTVSGLIQEEWPEMKLLLSSAIVNGGSVQANSSISFRDWIVKCIVKIDLLNLNYLGQGPGLPSVSACSWSWWSTQHQGSSPSPRRFKNREVPNDILCVHKFSISSFEKQREHLKYHFFGYLIFLL